MSSYKGFLYVRNIPEKIKKNFKLWCIRRGISLSKGVTELMKQASLSDAPDYVVEAKKTLEREK